MIKFINPSTEKPYIHFQSLYQKALENDQRGIEAISVSSYSKVVSEVEARYVNLKYIVDNEWIFFSNYNSPKAQQFENHSQVSILIYWASTNTQIRMKAKIKKTSTGFNKRYFTKRSNDKNAIAISSDQSKVISSYEEVIKKYQNVSKTKNLSDCPDYWGGYSFKPYEIEFWEGHESRINKRDLYKLKQKKWHHFVLEP